MIKENIEEYSKILEGKNAKEILEWAATEFKKGDIALSSSMGAEDQVLTDMILAIDKSSQIFTLDTGRLPEETYKVIDAVKSRYNKNVEVLFPNTDSVTKMVNSRGINLFYHGIEERKECCRIRKIEPLREKLKTLKVWITGLRREQSVTRGSLDVISFDEVFGLIKISPLLSWSDDDVWSYLEKNSVPYNELHKRGYPSIGCAPCTRAVEGGEDIRAGRWWWEEPEQKECGIHIVDGKIVPGRG